MTDEEFRAAWTRLIEQQAAEGGPFWLRQLSLTDDKEAALEALTAVAYVLVDHLGVERLDAVSHLVLAAFQAVRGDDPGAPRSADFDAQTDRLLDAVDAATAMLRRVMD